MEDVFGGSALSGEVLDVGIDGSDGSDGSSGGFGGDSDFNVFDLLRSVVSFRFSGCLRGVAFICAMSFLWHLKQSPSLMHRAHLVEESFFRQIVSTSMALGSLAKHGLEENEERGSPFPFLKLSVCESQWLFPSRS